MKEGQTAIYALTGPSRSHLENSPYLEAFKARGYEVAFFTDHGDEFVLDSLSSVDGKPVTMIDRADVELPALEEEQKDALPQEGSRGPGRMAERTVPGQILQSHPGQAPGQRSRRSPAKRQ